MERDDFPRGFFGESSWADIEFIARTFAKRPRPSRAKPADRVRTYRGKPVGAATARYQTEAWKAQHRIHARESARRKAAARRAAQVIV